MKHLALAGVLAGMMICASGAAQAADNWKFGLHNDSAAAVTIFATQENGAWSKNWLDKNIKPGEVYEMDFGHADGDCEVRTHIEFSDNSYFDAEVDYCKVSNLYIHNKDVKWD